MKTIKTFTIKKNNIHETGETGNDLNKKVIKFNKNNCRLE